MFTPPAEVSAVLAAFAPLFTEPSWFRAQALLCGVLLAPANHTLTAALRALGLAQKPGFQNYHRVLNRARWSVSVPRFGGHADSSENETDEEEGGVSQALRRGI
jgi:hypothetical protein